MAAPFIPFNFAEIWLDAVQGAEQPYRGLRVGVKNGGCAGHTGRRDSRAEARGGQ